MLHYEWNPSAVMVSADDDQPTQQPDPTPNHIFDSYASSQNFSEPTHFINPTENHFTPNPFNNAPHFTNYYDSLAYRGSASGYPGLGPAGFMIPKSEPVGFNAELTSRIGLNLGGRTYFSSSEDDFVNRLYRRSRIMEPGSVNAPRCQVEGCDADLTQAKHYHRRHKVCEFHSKSATVIAAGLTQRFCQQCSRFHLLAEFDNGKRSCRRRLADHNRRRRKSNQSSQENGSKVKVEKDAANSSSENAERSPQDSGRHSSSSVTVAVSPPRISLDYFGGRSYGTTSSTPSTSSSSLFY